MRITIVDRGIVLYHLPSKVLNNFCEPEKEHCSTNEYLAEYIEEFQMYDYGTMQELHFE